MKNSKYMIASINNIHVPSRKLKWRRDIVSTRFWCFYEVLCLSDLNIKTKLHLEN